MKKILVVCGVLFSFLALTVLPAQAVQITAKGVKGGLALTNMSGDDIEDNEAKIGFALGGFLTFNISGDFSVQPELLFVQKGTKWLDGDAKAVFRLTYLEIPILAKYSFPVGTNMNAFVFAGPALALKVGATAYVEVGDESDSENLDEAKGMDFGLAFGAGMAWPLGNNIFTFDVRYTLGLGNCMAYEGEDIKVKNGAILFLAGLGF